MKKVGKIAILLIIVVLVISTVIVMKRLQNHNTLEVLIVGDSIGEGAGASDPSLKWHKYLVPYMKETYNIKLNITNVSMGGNASYAGYVRVMELSDEKEYDLAIICYGENDKTEDFSLFYESILHAVKNKYPSCSLMTILESSQRDYTEKMKAIQTLSNHYGAYVADTIAAFKDSGRPYEDLCSDGTHPNDEGQKIYYETVKVLMDQFVEQKDNRLNQTIEMVDQRIYDFQEFKYYSVEEFEKVEDTILELTIQIPPSMLGIDYTSVKGENDIVVLVDEQTEYKKNVVWNNDFTLEFIELIAHNCKVNSKLQIIFSSEEQAEAFHGIVINEYR